VSQEISPQLEVLLQLAATIRRDHAAAKEVRASHTARLSDGGEYPKSLRPYVQQVKTLVGDWDDQDAAQTYHATVKATMQVWLSRAGTLLPQQLTADEGIRLAVEHTDDFERATYQVELQRFWNELSKVTGALDLRLLAIKYNLQSGS
jgi:hypothetical protein